MALIALVKKSINSIPQLSSRVTQQEDLNDIIVLINLQNSSLSHSHIRGFLCYRQFSLSQLRVIVPAMCVTSPISSDKEQILLQII
jgi:hypothetical protein